MKNFLFTGGSGYIGSHTAFSFLDSGLCHISILDNLSTGFRENYEFLKERFGDRVELIECDLCDIQKVESIIKNGKFDAVVHFAASLIVSESVEKPLLYFKNNTLNTTNLIDLCVKYGINKFIFSSTAAVYGEPTSDKMPIKESESFAPINPYGASKMMSEIVLKATSFAHKDFKYVALRYFNVAGANGQIGQRSKNATHLIKVACEVACAKRVSMSVFGQDYPTQDGTCIRDYIHINDLASAHLCAYEYLENGGDSNVFNVGYSHGYSVKEVIDAVKKISGADFKVIDAPRRAGDPANLVADNSKLKASTRWNPKYNDIEKIVKSAYLWEKKL